MKKKNKQKTDERKKTDIQPDLLYPSPAELETVNVTWFC